MKHLYQKVFFLSFFIGSISIFAQTNHQVLVANMSYTPSELTIEVGDQVTFILEVGMHDVNFNISTLTGEPFNNPVEISSLPMQSEPGVMGTITFDVAGTYNYDCSNYGHAFSGMVGSITVNPAEVESENPLTLQGVLDLYGSGNDLYSGTDGKAIHLVANSDIPDLSIFALSVANNGGGSDGPEYTLSGSANSGDDILVYRVGNGPSSATFFADYFGSCFSEFEITIATGTNFPDGNGDDPVELFQNDLVIDYYGDVNGEAMEGDPYEDSWTHRNIDGTWNEAGEDCDENDGNYSVYASGCIYPICDTGGDISGCMDETAFNYNPNATIDDGYCIPVMEGCMDYDASNYDLEANTSCSSCCEYIGCTDSTAFNYDSDATQDDGSCIYDTGSLTNALSLQGVMDFTVPSGGSDGKAIHLVATADIADLSVFGIGVANNGGGTDGMEYTLDSVSASSGDDILIARSVEAMSAYFADCYGEFEIIMVANSDISQNGDDAIELFEQGVAIETFGDLDVDGTGEAWEYMDSWAYNLGDSWIYGGVNCSDDSQTSATSDCPYPICSDTPIDILGCMDSEACNYNPSATQNDGSCTYADLYYDCDGNCINDSDMDGECDEVDYDDGLGVDELQSGNPQVIKMIDMLGRVHTSHNSGMLLFYIYSNGKVQGVIQQ